MGKGGVYVRSMISSAGKNDMRVRSPFKLSSVGKGGVYVRSMISSAGKNDMRVRSPLLVHVAAREHREQATCGYPRRKQSFRRK